MDEKTAVVIDYTNWRGRRSERRIQPVSMRFGSTEYHPMEQWLLKALDLDKDQERDFAMGAIHSWRPFAQPPPQPSRKRQWIR